MVKLSESDSDEACTDVAVSVGWLAGTEAGGA
jgi:hypothetical protein